MRLIPITLALLLLGACASSRTPDTALGFQPPSVVNSFVAGGVARAPAVSGQNAAIIGQDDRSGAERTVDAEEIEAVAQVKTVTVNEIDNGRICKKRPRPGSRIAETYCYTREVYAAGQEQRDEVVRQQMEDLRRQQANREAWAQMAEAARRQQVMRRASGR